MQPRRASTSHISRACHTGPAGHFAGSPASPASPSPASRATDPRWRQPGLPLTRIAGGARRRRLSLPLARAAAGPTAPVTQFAADSVAADRTQTTGLRGLALPTRPAHSPEAEGRKPPVAIFANRLFPGSDQPTRVTCQLSAADFSFQTALHEVAIHGYAPFSRYVSDAKSWARGAKAANRHGSRRSGPLLAWVSVLTGSRTPAIGP